MTRTRPAIERVWARVDRSNPGQCWIWPGATNGAPGRYGIVGLRAGQSPAYVHRLVCEHEVGVIPPGWQVDHLCRNTLCCNPSHLEAVTQQVNLMRGRTLPAINRAKTHCKNGHLFDEANTHVDERGGRNCRACGRDRRVRAYQAKKGRSCR